MSAVALQPATRAPEGGTQTAIDLEKMPVERVLAQLAVKPEQGLSSAEARQRLAKYGPNALVEKEVSLLRKIVGHFTGPNAYMIEAAAIVPGDIVKIRLGVIVPADLRLVGGDYASIDQAALTGESLPVAKKVG